MAESLELWQRLGHASYRDWVLAAEKARQRRVPEVVLRFIAGGAPARWFVIACGVDHAWAMGSTSVHIKHVMHMVTV